MENLRKLMEGLKNLNEVADEKFKQAKAVLKMAWNQQINMPQDEVYLSIEDRDKIKTENGGSRLISKIVPDPTRGIKLYVLLNFVTNNKYDFYTDDADLVCGDKTVVPYGTAKTVGDYVEALHIPNIDD